MTTKQTAHGDDLLEYSSERIPHEPVLQYPDRKHVVTRAKNVFANVMQKPSMQQVLDIGTKIGNFFSRGKRLLYIPLILFSVNKLNAQCCGLDYTMVGGWVGYESTRDDYYANRDNWWTRDGVGYHLSVKWQHGHMRYEITWATANHEKYQDADNRYKAYFPRVWWGIGYSPSDAEARLVIHGQVDGGGIRTIMKWSRQFPWAVDQWWWKSFHYSQINLYVWATLWTELNVDERFKIAATGNILMIPNGKLDNIPGGAVTPDFKWWVNVGLYFILY